jgi:hypothetical protein
MFSTSMMASSLHLAQNDEAGTIVSMVLPDQRSASAAAMAKWAT